MKNNITGHVTDLDKYTRDEWFNLLQITTYSLKLLLTAKAKKDLRFWVLVGVREQLIARIFPTGSKK